MPSGLSSERAAAFSPLTNSLSTNGSSLMMRIRLTGFFMGWRAKEKPDCCGKPRVSARNANKKGGRAASFPPRRLTWDYPGIALSRAARRLLCRAASFLWTTFLSAMRSIIPEALLKIFRAPALSPAAIAVVTLLIALVRAERRLALCLRRFSAWRAALRAPFVFAMRNPERKGAIVVAGPRKVFVRESYNSRMNLLKALATVSSMTFVSRILGFVRDALIARLFGAGLATDAFFVAFRIPNLLRRLFAEGAFSQAFVPVLSEYRTR